MHNNVETHEFPGLADAISEYDAYVMAHIKQLFDFDVWYEHSKNSDFPKEWYSAIRSSKP